jgi:20S proteasome alpha/beta subunit
MATAIGENDERIKEILRKEYKENMPIDACIKIALSIFHRMLGKNFDISRFEAAFIKTKEKKFTRLGGEELRKFLK